MTEHSYAGFWIRFLALLVDSVVLATVLVLLFAASIALSAVLGPAALTVSLVLIYVGPFLYWVGMQASARQATLGKALLGLKVTTTEGERISLLRSLGRELAKILSSIPLMFGYVIAAFTGRKQALHDLVASTTVIRENPGRVMLGLAIGVFGWVAPAGIVFLAGAGLFATLLGPLGGGALTSALGTAAVPQQTARGERASEQTPAPPSTRNAPATSAPASAAGQPTVLAARLTGIDEKPGMARTGPVLLELASAFGGSVRIKVYLPPLTEFRGVDPVVQVAHVTDSKGAELYDPTHQLESAFFQKVSMMEWSSPVPHLTGTRSVSLRSGASAGDAQRVEGKVTLSIPANTKTASFAAADVGKEQTIHGRALKLESFSAKEARLRFGGADRPLVAVTGYGSDGKPVVTGMAPGSAGAPRITFQAPAVRFEVVVAERSTDHDFPFVLTKGAATGAVASNSRTANPAATVERQVAANPPPAVERPAPTQTQVNPAATAQTPPPRKESAVEQTVASAEVSRAPRPRQQGVVSMVSELTPEAVAALDQLSAQFAQEAALIQGSFRERQVHYHDFGTVPRGVDAARVLWPIHGFDARGNPVAIRGQRPIFTTIPRLGDYSGLWRLVYVVTADMAQPNELRDAAAVDANVRERRATLRDAGVVLNLPIVPRGTTLARDTTRGTLGWYRGQDVQFFDFGPASQHGILDSIPDVRGDSAGSLRNLPVVLVDGVAASRAPSPLRAFADLRSQFPPRPTRSP